MSKLTKLKQKYSDLVAKTLACNKTTLIESFIEYYGGEYRSLIEKRYKELVFVYYVDWHMLKKAIDSFISTVENSYKYVDFISFQESKETPLNMLDKLTFKEYIHMPQNYIGSTNYNIISNLNFKSKIEQSFKRSIPSFYNYDSDETYNRIMVFPILTISENAIISAINLALTNQISNNLLTEKLLIEKAAREIAKIFKRRGGNLTSFCYGIPFDNTIDSNFYLINDFYKYYKKEIKNFIISDNKEALILKVGKENYTELDYLIRENYAIDSKEIELNKESCEKSLEALINNFK